MRAVSRTKFPPQYHDELELEDVPWRVNGGPGPQCLRCQVSEGGHRLAWEAMEN